MKSYFIALPSEIPDDARVSVKRNHELRPGDVLEDGHIVERRDVIRHEAAFVAKVYAGDEVYVRWVAEGDDPASLAPDPADKNFHASHSRCKPGEYARLRTFRVLEGGKLEEYEQPLSPDGLQQDAYGVRHGRAMRIATDVGIGIVAFGLIMAGWSFDHDPTRAAAYAIAGLSLGWPALKMGYSLVQARREK